MIVRFLQMDIVTFCASHISTAERIPLLDNAIQSVLDQNYKVCLFISISYESKDILTMLESTILSKYANNAYIKMFVQRTQMSQFEHYKFLINQIDPLFYNRTWVMFMDDDDYSKQSRSTWFHIYSKYKARNCKSIYNPYILFYCNDNNNIPTHSSCLKKLYTGESNTRVVSSREYIVYCVRLNVLNKFVCVMQQHNVLNTPLCDCVFGSVLQNTTNLMDYTRAESWGYAYNMHKLTSESKKNGLSDYKKIYKKELFMDLQKQFQFTEWKVAPGYSSVWDKKLFELPTLKQKFQRVFSRFLPIF